MLKECGRCSVLHRIADGRQPADYLDEATAQECRKNPRRVHSANGLDLRASDRLLVRHDRQRFQCGRGKLCLAFETEKTADVLGETRRSCELNGFAMTLNNPAAARR